MVRRMSGRTREISTPAILSAGVPRPGIDRQAPVALGSASAARAPEVEVQAGGPVVIGRAREHEHRCVVHVQTDVAAPAAGDTCGATYC